LVLVHDRANISPGLLETLKEEIIDVIKGERALEHSEKPPVQTPVLQGASVGLSKEMVKQISEILPGANVMAIKQVVKGRMETLDHFRKGSYLLSAVVALVGGLVVLVTMMGSVRERTPEIGIFRAIGYRKGHIMRIILLEIDLMKLLSLTSAVYRYRPIPRFPGNSRDIALIVDNSLAASRVQEVIESFPLVAQVTLFDVYSGEQVPQGKKSLALSIRFQSPERTLTDEEVNQAQFLIQSWRPRKAR
jgi:ferredoxin-fold anticodon binding domain-containing protein